MLDETSSREARANRIKSCPNCARIQNLKDVAQQKRNDLNEMNAEETRPFGERPSAFHMSVRSLDTDQNIYEPDSKKVKRQHTRGASDSRSSFFAVSGRVPQSRFEAPNTSIELPCQPTQRQQSSGGTNGQAEQGYPTVSPDDFQPKNKNLLGSPLTAQILGRQSHTRHASFDLTSGALSSGLASNLASRARMFSADIPATVEEGGETNEGDGVPPPPPPPGWNPEASDDEETEESYTSSDSEQSSSSSTDDDSSFGEQYSGVKNAKYVFLTLKEALVNSLVIIAFGCIGFYFIEGFSIIDSKKPSAYSFEILLRFSDKNLLMPF